MSDPYSDDATSPRRSDPLQDRRSPVERIPWAAVDSDQTRQADAVPEEEPESSGLYIPWWGFALVIVAVAAITCGLWGVVLLSRGDATTSLGPTPTPIFVVITATPTLGAAITDTPSPTPAVTDIVPLVSPTEPGQPIAIGSTVVVFGTEGSGLSLRQGPGLSFNTFFIGQDGEVFVVQDGPREADGFVWWYIADLNNPDRAGWSVENYLRVME